MKKIVSSIGLLLGMLLLGPLSHAGMGVTVINKADSKAPITVFYPSSNPEASVQRAVFNIQAAVDGTPVQGNRRLIVFSHGSGGSPWPMSDLARTLVEAGFVVAMPEHEGDNYHDTHLQGPSTWKIRPSEISAAIDSLQRDPRFTSLIDFNHVGAYGSSAGGLTVLTLAGGQWSPANFKRFCSENMKENFPACMGLIFTLHGDMWDGLKIAIARIAHTLLFSDETMQSHNDPRIKAVVASMPMAAPLNMASMAKPRVAVGLIQADLDAWLAPRFHVGALRAVCSNCTLVADMPSAGHGSLLSPWPKELAQSITPMLVDPPNFLRSDVEVVYRKISQFFVEKLFVGQ